MLPNCTASFPAIDIPTDMINAAAYLQFNPAHQVVSCPVTESEVIPNENVQRTIGPPAAMAETFFDPSSFAVIPASHFFQLLLSCEISSHAFLFLVSCSLLCSHFSPPLLGTLMYKTCSMDSYQGRSTNFVPEQFTGNQR